MAAPSASQISSGLLYANNWWSGAQVTFSIAGPGSNWPAYGGGGEPANANYQALTPAQGARFAAAADAWDQLIALRLIQVDDFNPGQIRVALTDVDALSGENIAAYAFAPPTNGGSGSGKSGDVWIDYDRNVSAFTAGSYDFQVMIHELGHALGLKHPFEDGAVLPSDYANDRYTVMAYDHYVDNVYRTVETTATGIRTAASYVMASTPLVFDILAIQARYGADPATAAGDTVYTWSQSTPFMQAVYDAGGIDTFDLSNITRGSLVDLTPGAYSSIAYYPAQAQAAAWTAAYPWAASFLSQQFNQATTYTWSQNLGIAYSTVIENVVGSSGADTILGNAANNVISGRAGDDSILGGAGQDYLRGDEGADQIVGGADFDDINGNMGDDTAWGGDGNDWVVGGRDNDVLFGEAGDDIVYGNLGADTLSGGPGADIVRGGQDNDSLSGGDGADWMSGDRGDDTISGGAGADVFHTFGEAGIDRVIDFSSAEGDRVLIDPGVTYTLTFQGGDTVIAMSGGGQMILVGVSQAALGTWLA